MPWNPDTYHRFQAERAAPFHDLLALVTVRTELHVADLGCGTGELTATLASSLPGSTVAGVDSSPEMLERAAPHQRHGLTFHQGRIEDLSGRYDLIFSNAALQWVPDHPRLLPRLWACLKPAGQLVVQVPSNFDHPSHRLLSQTATEEPFASALAGWKGDRSAPTERASPVLGLREYAELLHSLGGQQITALEKIYPVVLPDADGVLEWTSGTALVPYLERLAQELRPAFRASYRDRLWAQWPEGPVFYAFKRTLFAATRSA